MVIATSKRWGHPWICRLKQLTCLSQVYQSIKPRFTRMLALQLLATTHGGTRVKWFPYERSLIIDDQK